MICNLLLMWIEINDVCLFCLFVYYTPVHAKGANTMDVFSDRQVAKRLFTRQKWPFYALRSFFFFGIVKTALATLSKKKRLQGITQPHLPSEESFCRLTVRKNVQCIRTLRVTHLVQLNGLISIFFHKAAL